MNQTKQVVPVKGKPYSYLYSGFDGIKVVSYVGFTHFQKTKCELEYHVPSYQN